MECRTSGSGCLVSDYVLSFYGSINQNDWQWGPPWKKQMKCIELTGQCRIIRVQEINISK